VRSRGWPPQIIIQTGTFSRDSSGNVLIDVTLSNTGHVDAKATLITVAKIGSTNSVSAPMAPVDIGFFGEFTTLAFPPSVGASGTHTLLTIGGTYIGGSFKFTFRITLP
jgi:hypothetical protein